MGINDEMFEEQEQLLQKKAMQFKRNHDGIPKEERTGNGKYAKAYAKLRNEIMGETLKYACMGVRKGLLLDDVLVEAANQIASEKFREILLLVFKCEFDKLNVLLEQLQQKFLEEYYFPSWKVA